MIRSLIGPARQYRGAAVLAPLNWRPNHEQTHGTDGLHLSSCPSAWAQTPPAAPGVPPAGGAGAAGGGIMDYWWVILLIIIVIAAIWYFSRRGRSV